MTSTQADLTERARAVKEQSHRQFYEAFHAWFMESNCDFWSECDAPEYLAQIAVELMDKEFAAVLQSEREATAAEARRAALEEAAAVCEQNATRDLKGIILAPELAGKLPDDGDPFAPMLPDNGAAAQVANSVGKVRLHIAAEQIRALATGGPTGGDPMRIDRGKEWWLAKLSDEIARLRAELDAATATFDDEQAAHQDTLRLWQQAKAEIAALTEQQDRTMAALRWAFPLANMAMEGHRQERLRCGHRFGTKRIGLYDKEVQQIEDARRVLASPTPQDDLEGDVKHGNAEYFRAALAHAAAEARRAEVAADAIGREIVSIMETYDQQMAERGYVDTPGGLEHMGDVWGLLWRWRDMLASSTPQEP